MRIAISSGHGKYIRGAAGYLDEVDEARRVVEAVARDLASVGVAAVTFHDNVSHSQDENLERICNWHNEQVRDLDVSVHFNAYQTTSKPMGTECWYITQDVLAAEVANAMAAAGGFINRGPKYSSGLYFLNHTAEPALLLEVCFVDSSADAELYDEHFDAICRAIAAALSDRDIEAPDRPQRPPEVALPPPIPPPVEHRIRHIARESAIARYEWEDRGRAPLGYTEGVAMAFAYVILKYGAGDAAAREMAKAATGDSETDALSYYADVFHQLEMPTNVPGLATLRALWTLIMGLGMRESSGQHCCGRDMSADNVSAETCEAGAWQTSYNISAFSDLIDELMAQYSAASAPCQLAIFAQGVTCSAQDWECYGSGTGYEFQKLEKSCPQFAAEVAGVGLRNGRKHWGPIGRFEVEVRPEAEEMLRQVQALVILIRGLREPEA